MVHHWLASREDFPGFQVTHKSFTGSEHSNSSKDFTVFKKTRSHFHRIIYGNGIYTYMNEWLIFVANVNKYSNHIGPMGLA